MPLIPVNDPLANPSVKAASQTEVDAARLLLRLGLIIGFIVTPSALLVSQRSIFVLSPIAGALTLATGLALAPRMRVKDVFALLASPIGLTSIFISLWAFASLIWTPFPAEAAPRLLKIVSTFLSVLPVAAALPARSRAANLYVLPIGVASAAFGAIFLSSGLFDDRGDSSESETLLRAGTVMLLLFWPAAAAAVLRNRATLAASLAIVVVTAAISAHASAALAATGMAALAFVAASADRRGAGRWIGRIGAVSFVLAPALPLLFGPLLGAETPAFLSWLKVWNGILAADGPRMLTGHGFNYVMSGYFHGYLGPETPRSSLFEIWTDLGALGAVGCAALLYWSYQFAAAQSVRVAPYWMGALTFVTAIGVFGGANLQLWWITALALASVALILASRGDFQTERPTAPRQTG